MDVRRDVLSLSTLGRRLLLWMLLFALGMALIASAVQLLVEYRRDVAMIEERYGLVERSYLGSVVENVWVADRDRLGTLLDGLVRLPDFDYAEVRVDGAVFVASGQKLAERGLERRFPLLYSFRGSEVVIGELTVATNLDQARQRALRRAGDVLISVTLMALAFVGFLYLLVRSMITRHLVRIANYVRGASFSNLELPLYLDRQPSRLGRQDEFDQLVNAFNQMRDNLLNSYDELHELNADLEQRVVERTEALRRQVEESIRHQRALEGSESQLRAIFDSALEGIVVANGRGVVTVFNPAAEALFGYSATEMRGSSINRLMPDMDARHHDAQMDRYAAGGEARVVGRSREVIARRRDGSVFPVELAVSEARIGGERLFIGIIHDLSERKQIENALVQAKVMAEDASRAKSEFLSRMSHELRTPLNAIIGFGQLVLTDPQEPPTPSQQENVEQILTAGHHLLALINEVLDLASIEAGRHELVIEPIELLPLLEEAMLLVQPLAYKAGIRLLPVVLDELGPWVSADRMRLKQCLLNLLSNAIKYNRRDGHVRVIVDIHEDAVSVAVADTGLGFTEAQKPRLFEPFQRIVSETSGIEGTGIGLAITRRLLEMMDAHIDAESRLGAGSTFTILLRRAEPEKVGPDDTATEPLPVIAPSVVERQILYIEDNRANIALMKKMLARRADVRLDVAESGSDGLARLAESRPDLLLLDINLPGMNGLEVLRRIRADDRLTDLRVIAVSANAMPEDLEKAAELGFDDYLVKPFDMQVLFRLIDETPPAGN